MTKLMKWNQEFTSINSNYDIKLVITHEGVSHIDFL